MLGPIFETVYLPVVYMDSPPTDYTFVNGPPWFILTLLIFNVFYAFAPGEPLARPPAKTPSLFIYKSPPATGESGKCCAICASNTQSGKSEASCVTNAQSGRCVYIST